MTEHEYNAACAERERDDRWAAEACNDLLSATQANVLRLAMDCMPEAAVFLAETVFEQYDIDSDAFLEYLISDYLDSSMLLGADLESWLTQGKFGNSSLVALE